MYTQNHESPCYDNYANSYAVSTTPSYSGSKYCNFHFGDVPCFSYNSEYVRATIYGIPSNPANSPDNYYYTDFIINNAVGTSPWADCYSLSFSEQNVTVCGSSVQHGCCTINTQISTSCVTSTDNSKYIFETESNELTVYPASGASYFTNRVYFLNNSFAMSAWEIYGAPKYPQYFDYTISIVDCNADKK